MGWSLTGIVGGAMKGGGGAAEKHFVAEHEMALRLASARELADHNSKLEQDKAVALETWRDRRNAAKEETTRTEHGTALASAHGYAADSGFDPGTPGFHRSAQNYLNEKGYTGLAKEQGIIAKDMQADETKAAIAELTSETRRLRAGGGGGSGGSGGSGAGVLDIAGEIGNLAKMGVSNNGEKNVLDPSANAYLSSHFVSARKSYIADGMDPVAATNNALSSARSLAVRATIYADKNKMSFGESIGMLNQEADNANARKALGKGVEYGKGILSTPPSAYGSGPVPNAFDMGGSSPLTREWTPPKAKRKYGTNYEGATEEDVTGAYGNSNPS